MARPGGNPELSEHQFTTDRPEPLTKQLQLRIAESMWQQLKDLPNWREFVREAIRDRLDAEANATALQEQKPPRQGKRSGET